MKKTDNNQKQIVKFLRNIGATVFDCSAIGRGFPDIVVGIFGKNYLFEIKNPEYYWQLTPGERQFHDSWKGSAFIVETIEDVKRIIGIE